MMEDAMMKKRAPTRDSAPEPTATGWQGQVETVCARQGLHLTPLRRQVLTILAENSAPLGAYAIIDQLSRREGKPVAPPTVYRTLDFFLEHGFVYKIESRNAYAPCEHLGHAHQGVLLLCEKCGRSDEVEDLALAGALEETAERVGFLARRRMIELVGLCRDCGKAAA
jgi:Fur family zinc uptake transcriptional regulator